MLKHSPREREFVKSSGFKRFMARDGGASEKEPRRLRLSDGSRRLAELHWYEATGVGKKEFKIKRYLE